MIMRFATQRDINGNRYTLVIDTENKLFSRNINPYNYSDYISIGKRDRNKMISELEKDGFTPCSIV